MAYNREQEIRKEHNRIRKCLELNLCYICNTPPVPGKKYCERHLDKARQANRARREKIRREGGRCICCFKPLTPLDEGLKSCSTCRHDGYRMPKGVLSSGDFSIRQAVKLGAGSRG